jgi:hypothetical protein
VLIVKKFWDFDAVSVSLSGSAHRELQMRVFDNDYQLLVNMDRDGSYSVVFFGVCWNGDHCACDCEWKFIPFPLVIDSTLENHISTAVIDWLEGEGEFECDPICVGGGSNVPGYMF